MEVANAHVQVVTDLINSLMKMLMIRIFKNLLGVQAEAIELVNNISTSQRHAWRASRLESSSMSPPNQIFARAKNLVSGDETLDYIIP